MVVNSTNSDFAMLSDNNMAAILNNFSEDLLINILDSILDNDRISQPLTYGQGYVIANLINTYEINYNTTISECPACANELKILRNNVYHALMDRLCEYYLLSYVDDGSDPYALAFYMFEFLVSDFSSIITNFLTRYIIKEVENLHGMLEILNKDTKIDSTTKEKPSDKLDDVLYNLPIVITNILGMDISLEDILMDTYCNSNVSSFLTSHINDNGNFFKDKVATFIKQHLPLLVTNIRLSITQSKNVTDNIINYL